MRIRIIGLVNGEESPFDGQYVQAYDPSFCPPGGEYDGGLLLTTPDPEKAILFASAKDALECWNKAHGLRPDGKPNRPLTAFTCEVS